METISENKAQSNTSKERILSIDITRGFALICMVLVHFMIYYGNEEATSSWPYFLLNDGLADWGAAVFLMIMGISQVLSGKKHADLSRSLIFKRAMIRSVYLFIVGLLMLLLAFGPYEMWRWDILTLMGFATFLLFFCNYFPSYILVAICIAIAVLSPVARGVIDVTAQWGSEFVPVPLISNYLPGMFVDPVKDYDAVWELSKIIKGFFLSGYFPVMPWVMFSIMGMILGRRLVKGKMTQDLPYMILVGLIFLFLGIGGAYWGRLAVPSSVVDGFITPLSFYPDSFTMICVQTGMSLVVFSLIYYYFDVKKKDKTNLSKISIMLTRTSRFSLSFYFFHYMILGWPIIAIYLITGRYLLTDFAGPYVSLACGLTTVAILQFWLIHWEKIQAKYSLEWFMAVLTMWLAPTPNPTIKNTTYK